MLSNGLRSLEVLESSENSGLRIEVTHKNLLHNTLQYKSASVGSRRSQNCSRLSFDHLPNQLYTSVLSLNAT